MDRKPHLYSFQKMSLLSEAEKDESHAMQGKEMGVFKGLIMVKEKKGQALYVKEK